MVPLPESLSSGESYFESFAGNEVDHKNASISLVKRVCALDFFASEWKKSFPRVRSASASVDLCSPSNTARCHYICVAIVD